jgi:biotin transporter BioY
MEEVQQSDSFAELLPLLKAIGGNLLGWLIIALLFLVVLVYVWKRKKWNKGTRIGLTTLICAGLFGATYFVHFWAYFGEAFTSGVDHYRWPVMLTMNVLAFLAFLTLNLKTERLNQTQ